MKSQPKRLKQCTQEATSTSTSCEWLSTYTEVATLNFNATSDTMNCVRKSPISSWRLLMSRMTSGLMRYLTGRSKSWIAGRKPVPTHTTSSYSSYGSNWVTRNSSSDTPRYLGDQFRTRSTTANNDLNTLLFLERFLQDFQGTFIVVSHDREFLKRTCDLPLS